MVTITKSGEQYRITLPKEIIKLMKWVEGTEVIFVPILEKPNSKLSKENPLMIREVSNG